MSAEAALVPDAPAQGLARVRQDHEPGDAEIGLQARVPQADYF